MMKAFDDKSGDPILNVRLIRDPKTFVGKGIGYVQFNDKESMRQCIDELNNERFMGRPLRMKKAVEPRRLEKKKRRTEEKRNKRSEDREEIVQFRKEENDELDRLKNFEKSAYGGGDSSASKVPGLNKDSKKIKKANKEQKMIDHINKISKKSEKRPDDYGEIDISNKLGFKKSTQASINK
jgi:RNA recognition motif-containing protein